MKLSERWLASEQRWAMSYERWLEYVTQDAELDAQRYRKLKAKLIELGVYGEEPEPLIYTGYDGLEIEGPTFDSAVDALPEPK